MLGVSSYTVPSGNFMTSWWLQLKMGVFPNLQDENKAGKRPSPSPRFGTHLRLRDSIDDLGELRRRAIPRGFPGAIPRETRPSCRNPPWGFAAEKTKSWKNRQKQTPTQKDRKSQIYHKKSVIVLLFSKAFLKYIALRMFPTISFACTCR